MILKNFSRDDLRDKLRLVLNGDGVKIPKSVSLIRASIDITIFICIILSCSLIIFDYYMPQHQSLWISCEIFFTIIFAVEYIVRWYAAENRVRYPFTFFAIIDLAAILPSLFLISHNFLLLRLLRFARLLKLLRYNRYFYNSLNNLKNKYSAIREEYQLDHLGKLFFLSVIALIVGSNLVYFTEMEFGTKESPYSNYWESYWNVIIVLISGIEDKEPVSLAGKIEVTALLIAGICVVGMVTAELVSILVGKFSRKGKPVLKPINGEMENHIVILGKNSHLDYIIRQVFTAFSGDYYILVVSRIADEINITIPEVYKRVVVVPGDPLHPEVLKKADIDKAARVIVLPEGRADDDYAVIDNKSLMKTIAVNSLNPDVPITIQLGCSKTLKYTEILENSDFIVSSSYMEKLISQGVLNPGVTQIYRSLMTFSPDSNEFYKIRMPRCFEGKDFNDAQRYFFENEQSIIPVGVYEYSWDEGRFKCKINPMDIRAVDKYGSVKVNPGDYIMAIAYKNVQLDNKKKNKFFAKKTHVEKLGLTESIAENLQLNKDFSFKNLKSNSVVICNINKNLRNIIKELILNPDISLEITIVVQDEKLWEDNPEWHLGFDRDQFNIIFGDPADPGVLKKLGVKEFGAAVILADPALGGLADGPSSLIAMAIERLNPEIHTIMELIKSANREYIDSGVINEVVCLGDVTEKLIAQNCFHPGVIDIFDELLTSGKGTPQIFLPQVPIFLVERTYGEIYLFSLERKDPFIIIGFVKGDKFCINPEFEKEPGINTVLTEDDRLILISHKNYSM